MTASSPPTPAAGAPAKPHQTYFVGLAEAMTTVCAQGSNIGTQDFTELCDHILCSFDHLGNFVYLAKVEMAGKNESLKRVASSMGTLRDIVEADKRTGRAMIKNSCARNLHRLMLVISFVKQMLQALLENQRMSLKDAFYKAYLGSLASIHTYMLQTAVWAALGLLPTKEHFLKSIGESEESARTAAVGVIKGAEQVIVELEKLFAEVGQMPLSDFSYVPMAAPPAKSS